MASHVQRMTIPCKNVFSAALAILVDVCGGKYRCRRFSHKK